MMGSSISAAIDTQEAVTESTMTVVTREVRSQLDSIVAGLTDGTDTAFTLGYALAPHPDRAWIETLLLQAIEQQKGVTVVPDGGSVSLEIIPIDIRTAYTVTANPDSVNREIVVSVSGIYRGDVNSHIMPPASITKNRLLRSDAIRLQSNQLSSTHAELPTPESSFFDDILEPAIFVAAAVVTVVLAFTVRSK